MYNMKNGDVQNEMCMQNKRKLKIHNQRNRATVIKYYPKSGQMGATEPLKSSYIKPCCSYSLYTYLVGSIQRNCNIPG